MFKLTFTAFLFFVSITNAQQIKGVITHSSFPVKGAVVSINNGKQQVYSDTSGFFQINSNKDFKQINLKVYYPGFIPFSIHFSTKKDTFLFIDLKADTSFMDEIVIEVDKPLMNKKADPFNTEIYDACILASSSAITLFEGVQNINGLRPQLNCNICNTGDIHINGMEGPYTNILIDGMPVVGGIASIYGLTGISSDIIEKIEINRYPGSVLYGSDNIGGTINIITKRPVKNQTFVQLYTSAYLDNNLEISNMKKLKRYSTLNSLNLMYFDKIFDTNNDGFTDVTLQKRFSAFHKSTFNINDSTFLHGMIRLLVEDRWGGQTNWNKNFRGTDSIYGESIITKRFESIFKIPLFIKKIKLDNDFSYNYHFQNSYYGTLFFEARQHNFYYQSYTQFKTKFSKHAFGVALKYLDYTDNTVIFKNTSPFSKWIVPAIYSENIFFVRSHTQLNFSIRYDYHNIHKHIVTPRMAVLINPNKTLFFRSGLTTGFRPVQLFTEDHAALTGARKIDIQEKLLPEKSYVGYVNFQINLNQSRNLSLSTDWNAWYVYFSNRIIPDYSHPDKISYHNLSKDEYSINRGVSMQIQTMYKNFIQSIIGASLLDNFVFSDKTKSRLFLSEPWSGNFIIRLFVKKLTIEYTGNVYGKMKLPLAGPLDPRPDVSPVYSIQNIQVTYSINHFAFTTGVKNILDFTPDKNIPFLIARAHDPFDKNVSFDSNGNPLPTSENPNALTFDPTYTYASMQHRRFFINISFNF
ncbi:MAG TPA: TonB-dependent receptor plug domain-containing protein [Bacteroidia bacterium]|nr:TonB-dependent receptor plug domain-containing protein [Bacteroidia bacterium]